MRSKVLLVCTSLSLVIGFACASDSTEEIYDAIEQLDQSMQEGKNLNNDELRNLMDSVRQDLEALKSDTAANGKFNFNKIDPISSEDNPGQMKVMVAAYDSNYGGEFPSLDSAIRFLDSIQN